MQVSIPSCAFGLKDSGIGRLCTSELGSKFLEGFRLAPDGDDGDEDGEDHVGNDDGHDLMMNGECSWDYCR